MAADHNSFANLIWQIADLLRGPYRPPQYERVVLPMTVLRRFDCVLAPTKSRVVAEFERSKGGKLAGDALDTFSRINVEQIEDLIVPLPPPELQRGTVKWLARSAGAIDAVLAAKQRLLDLLAEKRKAIIATAITRGLDPEAEFRDSGVPWLGEVPAHWQVVPFRWHFRDLREYDVEYLAHVLRHRNLNSIANKTAQPLITGSMVTDLRGPLPPTNEQRAIVDHIARETAKLDAVRAATERTIALLKERRAALIAAAVTGQLDVGAAA